MKKQCSTAREIVFVWLQRARKIIFVVGVVLLISSEIISMSKREAGILPLLIRFLHSILSESKGLRSLRQIFFCYNIVIYINISDLYLFSYSIFLFQWELPHSIMLFPWNKTDESCEDVQHVQVFLTELSKKTFRRTSKFWEIIKETVENIFVWK